MITRLPRSLPFLSRRTAARGIIARANAARDGGHASVAAALYGEALRLWPHRADIHVQRANMLKDSGDFAGADRHYQSALRTMPEDADLALQIGHLQKLAGRLDEAEASYARALRLRPDWDAARHELASVSGFSPSQADGELPPWAVPALLPRTPAMHDTPDGRIRMLRLGRRTPHQHGSAPQLCGIEAVRGYAVTASQPVHADLLVDGQPARRTPLSSYECAPDSGRRKYVFNIWHDFAMVEPGVRQIEVRLSDDAGRIVAQHRQRLMVTAPQFDPADAQSDAIVPPLADGQPIEEAVNSRPSMVRSAHRRLLPEQIATILVQRTDQLGDLACSAPALQRLRDMFPAARLVGLVTPSNHALAESLGVFDAIETVDFAEDPGEARRILDLEGQARLRDRLAPYRFDLAIDLGEGDDSRPLLLLSGARFLYGFRHRQFTWLDAGLDFGGHDRGNGNDVVPPSRKFLLLIEGLAMLAREQAVPFPNPDRTGLAVHGIAAGDRYVLIHTGARLFFSRWPFFDDLVALLLDRTDRRIVLLGEPTAQIHGLQERHPGRLVTIAGHLPFAELDALVSHCALFIGNDSGPKHLAALRGAPVVSIHIARNNWSEWGQELSGLILSRQVPCAGCGIGPDGEDCGQDFACIRHIRPDEVLAAALQVLGPAN